MNLDPLNAQQPDWGDGSKKIKLGSKNKSRINKKLNHYFCSRATEKPEGEGSKKIKFVYKK